MRKTQTRSSQPLVIGGSRTIFNPAAAGNERRTSKPGSMNRALAVVAAGMVAALAQPAQAAPAAATASAHGGAVFDTPTASYIVRVDVERGFVTALPGQFDVVKQVLRCERDGSDCELVAQEAGPLQDGESFTLTTDHKARLKARWLGFPLVMTWDRYNTLPEQKGSTTTYGHGNWTENYADFSLRFVRGDYMMLGAKKACVGMNAGMTIISQVATSERARFVTEPLPLPATLKELRNTKGRCRR